MRTEDPMPFGVRFPELVISEIGKQWMKVIMSWFMRQPLIGGIADTGMPKIPHYRGVFVFSRC